MLASVSLRLTGTQNKKLMILWKSSIFNPINARHTVVPFAALGQQKAQGLDYPGPFPIAQIDCDVDKVASGGGGTP